MDTAKKHKYLKYCRPGQASEEGMEASPALHTLSVVSLLCFMSVFWVGPSAQLDLFRSPGL